MWFRFISLPTPKRCNISRNFQGILGQIPESAPLIVMGDLNAHLREFELERANTRGGNRGKDETGKGPHRNKRWNAHHEIDEGLFPRCH